MDAISKLAADMVAFRVIWGHPPVELRIGQAAGNRLVAAARPLSLEPPTFEQPAAVTTFMGLAVTKAPDWWPQDLVGMKDGAGKWHFVRIGGGDEQPV